ncbi:MAG: hypothetical protein GXX80_03930 [Thermotogaceae bacterium]|nr:hypothetical protein [Thermotogaceae bacterium]
MIKYSEFIRTSPAFKSVVNIVNDFDDEKQVGGYIPTKYFNDLLSKTIKKLQYREDLKPFLLTGTYGTGKSHTLLALTHLLSDDIEAAHLKPIIERLQNSWPGTRNQLVEFRKTNRYLPVVLFGYGDFDSMLIQSVNKALSRKGMDDLTVESIYYEAQKRLQFLLRDTSQRSARDFIEKSLREDYGIDSLADLQKALENYQKRALDAFRDIHLQVFNLDFVGNVAQRDIKEIYVRIARKLESQGFSGIVLVWDEFSTFLSQIAQKRNAIEAQKLNDFAEACNVKDVTILPIFVSHLGIHEYGSASLRSQQEQSDLAKLEARFERVHLSLESLHIYRLLSNVLIRDSSKYEINRLQMKPSKELQREMFSKIFEDVLRIDCRESEIEDISSGLFPLHPMAVPALIKVSELVAQNERTIFTFLNDYKFEINRLGDQVMGFAKFIELTSVEQNKPAKYFTTAELFDYFADSLEEDPNSKDTSKIVMAYRQLSSNLNAEEKRVLKTIALLEAIGEQSIRPSRENIVKCFEFTEISKIRVEQIIDKMHANTIIYNLQGSMNLSYGNTMEVLSRHQALYRKYIKDQTVDIGKAIMCAFNMESETVLNQRSSFAVRRMLTRIVSARDKKAVNSFVSEAEKNPCELYVMILCDLELQGAELIAKTNLEDVPPNIVLSAFESSFESFYSEICKYQAWIDLPEEFQEFNMPEMKENLRQKAEAALKDLQNSVESYFSNVDIRFVFFDSITMRDQTYNWEDFRRGQKKVVLADLVFSKTPQINDSNLWSSRKAGNLVKAGQLLLGEPEAREVLASSESAVKRIVTNSIKSTRLAYQANKEFVFEENNASKEMKEAVGMIRSYIKNDGNYFSLDEAAEKLSEAPYGISGNILYLLFCYCLRKHSLNGQISVARDGKTITPIDISRLSDAIDSITTKKESGKFTFSIFESDIASTMKKVFGAATQNISDIASAIRDWFSKSIPVGYLSIIDDMDPVEKKFMQLIADNILKDPHGKLGKVFLDSICQLCAANGFSEESQMIDFFRGIMNCWMTKPKSLAVSQLRHIMDHAFEKGLDTFLEEYKEDILVPQDTIKKLDSLREAFCGNDDQIIQAAVLLTNREASVWDKEFFSFFLQQLNFLKKNVLQTRDERFFDSFVYFLSEIFQMPFEKWVELMNKREGFSWERFGSYEEILDKVINVRKESLCRSLEELTGKNIRDIDLKADATVLTMKIELKSVKNILMSKVYAEKLLYLRKYVDTIFHNSLDNWLQEFATDSNGKGNSLSLWHKRLLQSLLLPEPDPVEVVSLVESKLGQSALEITNNDFEYLKSEIMAEKSRIEQSANRVIQSTLEEVFMSIEPVESNRILYRKAMKKYLPILEAEGNALLDVITSDQPVMAIKQVLRKKTHEITTADIFAIKEELGKLWNQAADRLSNHLVHQLVSLLNNIFEGDYERWFAKQNEESERYTSFIRPIIGSKWEALLSNNRDNPEQVRAFLVQNGHEPLQLLLEGLDPIEKELRRIVGEINTQERPIPESVLEERFSAEKLFSELERHGIRDKNEVLSIIYYTVSHMDDASKRLFKKWLNNLLT